MYWEIFGHEYFWLSFLPISFLGVGFWLLFFDRARSKKAPLQFLFFALGAGFLSTVLFMIFAESLYITNPWGLIFWEEFFKVIMAILAMEIFKKRFDTIAGGVVYGFAVGLGFALAENLVYLSRIHDISQFGDTFWLAFQGRFWSSTIIHGVTMAVFGLFYASAYLSQTIAKKDHESPLTVFFKPPNVEQIWHIFSLHVTREHLLFQHFKDLNGHSARAVILEGFLVALLIHGTFNFAIEKSYPEISILLALSTMWWLRVKVEKVSSPL